MRAALLVLASLATVAAALLAVLAAQTSGALVLLFLGLTAAGCGVCRLIVGGGDW